MAVSALLLSVARAQFVVTSTTTEITGATFVAPSGDAHFRDYVVSYGFGGAPAPSFSADLAAFDEFVYRVTAPEGQMFTVNVPASGAPQSGWIVMSLDWVASESAAAQVNFDSVSFVLHDYTGPGLGTTSFPLTIRSDGTGISMPNGAQQLLAGTHTFSGFSLTGGYSSIDTSSWTPASYAHGQFWVNYYIGMTAGSPEPGKLSLIASTEAAAVPEPQTAAALLAALALLFTVFRRAA